MDRVRTAPAAAAATVSLLDSVYSNSLGRSDQPFGSHALLVLVARVLSRVQAFIPAPAQQEDGRTLCSGAAATGLAIGNWQKELAILSVGYACSEEESVAK
ncbi:uncharacterized protein EI97DRAFT_431950 [Westerdykella ornata]|uniref:Uncharacterized protein n=1 Tax=Westerdykella ornata TaxID=318751 RepID=A0A6A6JMJ4_WESOR|nr:uncharacterized protein EI97DRAFT_431950 [Westerdykella ornata]KAF2277870.1 hypothetical protein EI97DRAFT_431950 [Westerdykella ornata]